MCAEMGRKEIIGFLGCWNEALRRPKSERERHGASRKGISSQTTTTHFTLLRTPNVRNDNKAKVEAFDLY